MLTSMVVRAIMCSSSKGDCMTIECYHGACPYHSVHEGVEEGPFCFERECVANREQFVVFDQIRNHQLALYGFNRGPNVMRVIKLHRENLSAVLTVDSDRIDFQFENEEALGRYMDTAKKFLGVE